MRIQRPYSLIILCGGRGSRMGGVDKGWLPLAHTSFIELLLRRFDGSNAVGPDIVISANRNIERYQRLGATVVTDSKWRDCGPLGGVSACIPYCRSERAVVLPCDMPGLPADLPARLLAGLHGSTDISVAHDGDREQHLCFAFHPLRWQENLDSYLGRGQRSVKGWLRGKQLATVRCADTGTFAHVNNPAALNALQHNWLGLSRP